MTLEKMTQKLQMQTVPECFSAIYHEIRDSWEDRAQQILSDDYIKNTLADSYTLAGRVDIILQAAGQLRQNKALCLLVCLLERWVRQAAIDMQQYQPPAGVGLAYDFLHLFPAISTMPESVAHLRQRGVPEEVIVETMAEYDYCVDMCQSNRGRPAFDLGRLRWIRCVITNRLIRIGRFKYDLPGKYMQGFRVYREESGNMTVLADGITVHCSGGVLGSAGMEDAAGSFTAQIEETETAVTGHPVMNGLVKKETVTLDKAVWRLVLSGEDNVPRIHIPPGNGFDKETMEASFEKARKIFRQCYPERPFKAFFCHTWLLSPQLRTILKPESNILTFQNLFTPIPCYSQGNGCFSFLFGMTPKCPQDFMALPEKTSLQRAVKQLYLDGGYLLEGEGFFF